VCFGPRTREGQGLKIYFAGGGGALSFSHPPAPPLFKNPLAGLREWGKAAGGGAGVPPRGVKWKRGGALGEFLLGFTGVFEGAGTCFSGPPWVSAGKTGGPPKPLVFKGGHLGVRPGGPGGHLGGAFFRGRGFFVGPFFFFFLGGRAGGAEEF